MEIVFIGIGSNVGERDQHIQDAITLLENDTGIRIEAVSSLRETDPVGGPPQGPYLNGVIKVKTLYSAYELLRRLQRIEFVLGRSRTVENGPRTIDLDILLYGDERIEEEDLKIPHPKMYERDFVLTPLFEIAPELKDEIASFKSHTTQGHKVTRGE